MVADDGEPAAEQGRRDDREFGTRGGIAVPAGAAHDAPGGIGVDIDVKIRVDLCRAEDGNVERIHDGAFCTGACVLCRADLAVVRIIADGGCRLQIKALHIHQRTEAALVEHIDQIPGNTALRVAAVDLLTEHDLLEIHGRGKCRAAGAGLEREAVTQKPGILDDPRRRLCHDEGNGIARHARGAGHDPRRIADGVDLHDVVHIDLRDRPAGQRIFRQLIGDDDHLFCVHRVRERISKTAAGGSAVLSRAVSHAVGAWRGDKGHIDGGDAQRNIARAAAVRTELDRLVHQAGRDLPADPCGDVVCLHLPHDVVFDVVQKRRVCVKQRTGIHGQIADAHGGDLIHDKIQHIVAVPEMVVEGDRHAVLQSGQRDRLADGFYQLRIHASVPPRFRICSASASVRFARAAIGASIILPCSATAPRPCRFPSSSAASTSFA